MLNNTTLPFVRVSGYTIQQIEKYVFDNATFSGLTEDLIRYLDNSTEQYLWELRNQWD